MNLPAISRTAERRVRVIPMSYNAYNTKFLSEVNLAFRDLGSQFFPAAAQRTRYPIRSEEHTSELQSLMRISYAVFCLKKKKQTHNEHTANLVPTPPLNAST